VVHLSMPRGDRPAARGRGATRRRAALAVFCAPAARRDRPRGGRGAAQLRGDVCFVVRAGRAACAAPRAPRRGHPPTARRRGLAGGGAGARPLGSRAGRRPQPHAHAREHRDPRHGGVPAGARGRRQRRARGGGRRRGGVHRALWEHVSPSGRRAEHAALDAARFAGRHAALRRAGRRRRRRTAHARREHVRRRRGGGRGGGRRGAARAPRAKGAAACRVLLAHAQRGAPPPLLLGCILRTIAPPHRRARDLRRSGSRSGQRWRRYRWTASGTSRGRS